MSSLQSRGALAPPQTSALIAQRNTSIYAGPLPHPDIIAGFESIQPGAADRIISMAENEAKQRHQIETKEQERIVSISTTENKRVLRGQIFSFSIVVIGFGGGIFLIAIGRDTAGFTSLVSALATLVTAFIIGKVAGNKSS
jgi:uncharacterized membrane protein